LYGAGQAEYHELRTDVSYAERFRGASAPKQRPSYGAVRNHIVPVRTPQTAAHHLSGQL
jgi:hypothetical protein